MQKITCNEIANFIEGRLIGSGDLLINKLNRIADAVSGELTFYSDKKYLEFLNDSKASCIILKESDIYTAKPDQALIYADNPYQAFLKLIILVDSQQRKTQASIHESASIHASASIGNNVSIGAGCVIAEGCELSDGVILKPNVVLYENVSIGINSVVHSHVVLYHDTVIGQDCIIHSGAVIGADGFGYQEDRSDGKYTKIPQIGNVVLKDNVEIGANTAIDRAMVGSTILENGVKLDNLVQVAHNCKIGENSAFSSQTGISGSVTIGKRCRFGGKVGLADNIEIADDVILMASTGVAKSITQKGVYFGAPARDFRTAFKIEAVRRNLPELSKDVDVLKSTIKRIEAKIQ